MAINLRNLMNDMEMPIRGGGIASYMPTPAPTAPEAPSDPYAPIKSLPKELFSPMMQRIIVQNGGGPSQREYEMNEDGSYKMAPAGNALQVNEAALKADPTLSAYQSKYNQAEDLGDGRIRVRMQQPGAHKYDLMDAIYKLDEGTGQYVLQADPTKIKQQSSKTELGQAVGTVGAFMLGSAYAPQLSAAMGGGALGGAAAGAATGGIGALAGGANSDQAAKAALAGGIAGGAAGYFSPPSSVPPAAEGIDGFSGLPEYAIDPPGSLANSATTATSGVPNALEEYLKSGASDMSAVSGQGGYAGAIFPNTPEILGTFDPSAYQTPTASTPTPTEQTIEITGQRPPDTAPTTPPAATAGIGAVGSQLPPESNTPGGRLGETAVEPSNQDRFLKLLKDNPRLAMQALGAVGGLFGGGGGSGSGGGLAASQAGMTATQAPKFQRQYVAPPPGYRPGFDPEHKYFTGIGAVGTGG